MRRTRAVAVIGALALAACGGDDGGEAAEPDPTTTEAPAPAEQATTTTAAPAVAGVIAPPAGFAQEQADAFASDMVVVLTDSGWPQLSREDSVALLQEAANLGGGLCGVADATAALPGAEGTDAVEAAISHMGREQQPALAAEIEAQGGTTPDGAQDMADGFVRGVYLGAGEHLCPQHAASFEAAAALYL